MSSSKSVNGVSVRRHFRALAVVAAAAISVLPAIASAQSFGVGNLVVVRVGDGSAALTNAGTASFLDEYDLTGTLVRSVALPTSSILGGNNAIVVSGTATSDGALHLSSDGRYLTLAGYSTAPGSASVTSSSVASVPRVVARVDANGVIDTTTLIGDAYSGNNFRSAASIDGTGYWVGGGNSGVRYVPHGNATGTPTGSVSTTVTNNRVVSVQGGQLFASNSSGTNARLMSIGVGAPTGSASHTPVPGLPTSGSVYGYAFFDLSASVAGFDTLYTAGDAGAGLRKYSLVAGTWTLDQTLPGNFVNLAGTTTSTGEVRLFATTVNGSGVTQAVVSLTDSAGYQQPVSGSIATLISQPTNTSFRGLAFAPTGGAIVPTAFDLRWNVSGPASAEWDTSSAHWISVTGTGGTRAFINGDNVTFDASASTRTVNLNADVAPRSLTLSDQYTFTGSGLVSVTNALTFSNADLTINSTGTGGIVAGANPVLSGNNTFTVNSGLLGFGGTLNLAPGQSLTVNGGTASAGPVTLSGGTLAINPAGTFAVGTLAITGQPLTVAGTLTATGQVSTDNLLTVSGRADASNVSVAPNGSLRLPTGSLLVLTGGNNTTSNLFTDAPVDGVIEVPSNNTRLNFNPSTYAGTGVVKFTSTTTPGNNLSVSVSGTLPGGNVDLALDLQLNASSSPLPASQFTLNLGATNGADNVPHTLTYSGVISGDGNVNLASTNNGGAGLVVLTGKSVYTGNTTVNNALSSVIRLGTDDALPTTSLLTFNPSNNTNSNVGSLDLGGFSQTLAGLGTGAANQATTNAASAGRIVNTAGSPAALILNVTGTLPTGSTTFNGSLTGAISLSKTGDGTQTFTGSALAHTGNTTVTGGELVFTKPLLTATSLSAGGVSSRLSLPGGQGALNNLLVADVAAVTASDGATVSLAATDLTSNKPAVAVTAALTVNSGRLDLANNDLIVRNTSLASVEAGVGLGVSSGGTRGLVATQSGLFNPAVTEGRDVHAALAVASATSPFGFTEFATFDGIALNAGDVIIKYTYAGDTNLDGLLDARDFNAVLNGLSNGLSGWRNGDIDLDGTVSVSDFARFLAAYQFYNEGGAPFGIPTGGTGGSAIPEPAALSLLAPATLLLSRRRR